MTINSPATNNSNEIRPMTKGECEEYVKQFILYVLKNYMAEEFMPFYDPADDKENEGLKELTAAIQQHFLDTTKHFTPSELWERFPGILIEDIFDRNIENLSDKSGTYIHVEPGKRHFIDEYTQRIQEEGGDVYDKQKLVHAICVLQGKGDYVPN